MFNHVDHVEQAGTTGCAGSPPKSAGDNRVSTGVFAVSSVVRLSDDRCLDKVKWQGLSHYRHIPHQD